MWVAGGEGEEEGGEREGGGGLPQIIAALVPCKLTSFEFITA
jgi:hypothetical protein